MVAFDNDSVAVEKNYLECMETGETKVLPLLLDLSNPSPGNGWRHQETGSLIKRGPANMIFAPALLHNLAISNNLPFNKIAEFFRDSGTFLLIEFISKNDSQLQRLLAMREDVYPEYAQQCFERGFEKNFIIRDSVKITASERTMYLMEKRKS